MQTFYLIGKILGLISIFIKRLCSFGLYSTKVKWLILEEEKSALILIFIVLCVNSKYLNLFLINFGNCQQVYYIWVMFLLYKLTSNT